MDTKTSSTYTADQCRREYTPKIKRAQVLEIGTRFGLTLTAMRTLIEGPEARVKRQMFAGQQRGYFDLEEVLREICPSDRSHEAGACQKGKL